MKLTYKRDEVGDYYVFSGSQNVGEIYKSAFANWWVIYLEENKYRDEGYTTLKDAKARLEQIINQ